MHRAQQLALGQHRVHNSAPLDFLRCAKQWEPVTVSYSALFLQVTSPSEVTAFCNGDCIQTFRNFVSACRHLVDISYVEDALEMRKQY